MYRRRIRTEEMNEESCQNVSILTNARNDRNEVKPNKNLFIREIEPSISRDVKKLGAKVISHRFKGGIIKGLRTKDELLGKTEVHHSIEQPRYDPDYVQEIPSNNQTPICIDLEHQVEDKFVEPSTMSTRELNDKLESVKYTIPQNRNEHQSGIFKNSLHAQQDGVISTPSDCIIQTANTSHNPRVNVKNTQEDNDLIKESHYLPKFDGDIFSNTNENRPENQPMSFQNKNIDGFETNEAYPSFARHSSETHHALISTLPNSINSRQQFLNDLQQLSMSQDEVSTRPTSPPNVDTRQHNKLYGEIENEPRFKLHTDSNKNIKEVDSFRETDNNPSMQSTNAPLNIKPSYLDQPVDLDSQHLESVSDYNAYDMNQQQKNEFVISNKSDLNFDNQNVHNIEEKNKIHHYMESKPSNILNIELSSGIIPQHPNFASSPLETRETNQNSINITTNEINTDSSDKISQLIANINISKDHEERGPPPQRPQQPQINSFMNVNLPSDTKSVNNSNVGQVHGGHPPSYPPFSYYPQFYSHVPYRPPYLPNIYAQQQPTLPRETSFPIQQPMQPNPYYSPYQMQPDYNSIVYAKWQEDYAKWYRTYCSKTSNRQSRTNSIRSNTALNYPYDSTSEFPGFNYQRSSYIGDPIVETQLNQTVNIKPSRGTPLPYQSVHATSNFGPNNTILLLNNKRISICNINHVNVVESIEFPGPLNPQQNTAILLKYMKLTVKQLGSCDTNIKLMWKIMYSIIENNGTADINKICNILIYYNSHLHVSSIYNYQNPKMISDETHFKITSDCLSNDVPSAVASALECGNIPLAFALSYHIKDLHQKVLNRYLHALDSQDLIRSLISLNQNNTIDISFINNNETVDKWNQYVAVFLSKCATSSQCTSYITSVSKILQSKGRVSEASICGMILDLVLNSHPIQSHIFHDTQSIDAVSSDPTLLDIKFLRTLELYEYVKSLQGSRFSYRNLYTYKYLYSEILYNSGQNEKCYDYLHVIVKSILSDSITTLPQSFLVSLLHLSKSTHHVLFHSSTYPAWLLKLENFVKKYSNLKDILPQTIADDSVDKETNNIQNLQPSKTPQQSIDSSNIPKSNPLQKFDNKNVVAKNEPRIPPSNPLQQEQNKNTNTHENIVPFTPQSTIITNDQICQVDTNIYDVPFLSVSKETYLQPSLLPPHMNSSSLSNVAKISNNPSQTSILSPLDQPPSRQIKSISETKILESRPVEPKKHIESCSSNLPKESHQYEVITNVSKIFSKFFRSRDDIYLPDDSNPTIILDETTNRYIDITQQNNASNQAPIPKLPPTSISNTNNQRGSLYSGNRAGTQMYLPPKY